MMDDSASVPDDPNLLDAFIREKEQRFDLKPGTEATIRWHREPGTPTEYAIVYLHGFKATHPEGDPVHKTVAGKFHYNLYLSRLEEHGISSGRPLLELSEQKLLDSAHFALEIGKRIGKKVILIGTSTGGSLALYLAARQENRKHLAALILYSPLIDFYGPQARLLRSSFFRSILNIVPGKRFSVSQPDLKIDERYIWYNNYALQGALALGQFVQNHMHRKTFERVNLPVFTGYYYKNRRYQDKVVSVRAIKRMVDQLDTNRKSLVNFPNANTHVICSNLLSGSVDAVIRESSNFISNHCQTAI